MTDMTDEQLGRLWCERYGKRPECRKKCHYARIGMRWVWVYDDGPGYGLPFMLWDALDKAQHQTESDAYSAVGAALRDLHRLAEEIRGILGDVL